jgi:hypothetical protein
MARYGRFQSCYEERAIDVLSKFVQRILGNIFYVNLTVKLGQVLLQTWNLGVSGDDKLESRCGLKVV